MIIQYVTIQTSCDKSFSPMLCRNCIEFYKYWKNFQILFLKTGLSLYDLIFKIFSLFLKANTCCYKCVTFALCALTLHFDFALG